MGKRISFVPLVPFCWFSLLVTTQVYARTWYVAVDGSGDAPNIPAAVDSSTSGDQIIVRPGTYIVARGVLLKSNTSLLSEMGPVTTILKPRDFDQPGLVALRGGCSLSGFTMQSGLSSAVNVSGDGVEISYNIVEAVSGGSGIVLNGAGYVHNNLSYGSSGNAGIAIVSFDASTQINNNIVLNGMYSNLADCPPLIRADCNLIDGQQNCFFGGGNFSGNPLFCGASSYYLRADSPCAPGNHPDGADCGLIGPLPVACGPVRVKQATWGQVKSFYMD